MFCSGNLFLICFGRLADVHINFKVSALLGGGECFFLKQPSYLAVVEKCLIIIDILTVQTVNTAISWLSKATNKKMPED